MVKYDEKMAKHKMPNKYSQRLVYFNESDYKYNCYRLESGAYLLCQVYLLSSVEKRSVTGDENQETR